MGLKFDLSKKVRRQDGLELHQVLARYHNGTIYLYGKTYIYVPEQFTDHNGNKKVCWDGGNIVVPKISFAHAEQVATRQLLIEAKACLARIAEQVTDEWDKARLTGLTPDKQWLQDIIDGVEQPQKARPTATTRQQRTSKDSLCDIFERYTLSDRLTISDSSRRQYCCLVGLLRDFEAKNNKPLYLDTLSADDLHAIRAYLIGRGQGENSAARRLKWLRTFVRWANGLSRTYPITSLTHNNPFDLYNIPTEVYGTPYYLTLDERNKLAEAQLPERLARQRDIFIFQCLIGCRVSDLWAMTKTSIIDGAVEYIPRKTKDGRPVTVRVPLNDRAKAILDRYKDIEGDKLFPFVAQQQYNEDIKEMLRLAGITRTVTILDSTTRQEVKRPIYEVASSHMARRTFIGNLYKQVKDPNLIGKLSGHVEGSKAFARYRDIDEDMARDLVSLLE